MSFVSFEFLIFLAIFFAAWPFVRKQRSLRLIGMTVASFLFYGWYDWRFVILLIFSGGIDFFAAIAIERWPTWRRLCLWSSITMNLSCLFFFKYLGFAGDQLRAMLDLPPETWSWTHSVVLPIGISFYTFQSMSYTIDVYRGRLRAVRDMFHFFAYLAMFPQLVAGPIVRAVDLLPQLEHEGNFNRVNRWNGLQLMALGFFKKLVVADNIAPLVNVAFGAPTETLGGATWWLAAFAFGGQIYCDFSGYSDIACGIALWLGYSFNANFRHPYAAVGFQDFWARWHISLSTWFRDYVYIPLGGSRRKAVRNAANLWFTMLVSGLWHGANWTFVIWGALHAVFLTCEKIFVPRLFSSCGGTLRVCVWLLTLACVTIAWVAFRADSTEQLFQIWQAMFVSIGDGSGLAKLITPSATLGIGCLIVVEATCVVVKVTRKSAHGSAWFPQPSIAGSVVVLLMFFCSIFLRGPGSDFIYFAF